MLHDERVEDEFRFLWEQKWSERENLLIDLFGPTEPSGIVLSFPWEGLGFGIPGACALPFPPRVQDDRLNPDAELPLLGSREAPACRDT